MRFSRLRHCLFLLVFIPAAMVYAFKLPNWLGAGHKLPAPTSQDFWPVFRSHLELVGHVPAPILRRPLGRLMAHPHALYRLTERAQPYLATIFQEAARRHMPAEVALIPMIESQMNPFSYSRRGATGLWQLMPGTAAGLGLTMDWWYDGRRDLTTSTRAALSYLAYLHGFFHNWLLAIAAYDAGEGRILSAIRTNIRLHRPTDIWSLSLPRETKAYVPKLLALATAIKYADRYHFKLAAIPSQTPYRSFTLPFQMHLSQLAHMANISTETVRAYNPGFRRDLTGPHLQHFLVPNAHASAFARALSHREYLNHYPTWHHYQVNIGDTLSTIAHHFNTKIAALKQANHLKGTLIRFGQFLLIPGKNPYLLQAVTHLTTSKAITEEGIPGPKHVKHQIKPFETLRSIARRHHVTVAQLCYWNGINQHTRLVPGHQLHLWISHHRHRSHHRKAHAKTRRTHAKTQRRHAKTQRTHAKTPRKRTQSSKKASSRQTTPRRVN